MGATELGRVPAIQGAILTHTPCFAGVAWAAQAAVGRRVEAFEKNFSPMGARRFALILWVGFSPPSNWCATVKRLGCSSERSSAATARRSTPLMIRKSGFSTTAASAVHSSRLSVE